MASVLEGIVGMVIMAMLAGSITALAISPIKTQRQKNNFAAAESMAIAVRKHVVEAKNAAGNNLRFLTDADILVQGNYSGNNSPVSYVTVTQDENHASLQNGTGCIVKEDYTPPASSVAVRYAAICAQGSGSGSKGQAWQPLYTVANLNEQVAAGTASINVNTCINDLYNLVKTRKYASNPGNISFTQSNDLSSLTSCNSVSNITFETSNWGAARGLCDVAITFDGNTPANNKYMFTFKDLNANGTCK